MKKMIPFLFLIFLTGVLLPAQTVLEENGFEMSCEVREERLVVNLKGDTTGWLAFGTNASDRMEGADIIILWVDDALGIAMGEDHFGTGPLSHEADMSLGGEQNMLVLSGRQTKEDTAVTFTIPLNSGDEYDTELISGESYPLILAMGQNDNIETKHSRVYTAEITIP